MITRTIRRSAVLAAGVLVATLGQATSDAPVASAHVVLSYEATSSGSLDSTSPKTAVATCKDGKVVLGGGGWAITQSPGDQSKVLLTAMVPRRVSSRGDIDGYEATAHEVGLGGMSGNWFLVAYAICGNKSELPDYFVNGDFIDGKPVKDGSVGCRSNSRLVFGAGAEILHAPHGQATLQRMLVADSRLSNWTTAKEDPDGFQSFWQLWTYSICANDPGTHFLQYGHSGSGSQSVKTATVDCGASWRVHSAGATVHNAPAGVAIVGVVPAPNLRSVTVTAVETTPISANWTVSAQALCGP